MKLQPTRVLRFLGVRLLSSAVVLFGVLVVVFALVHLVPGDPVRLALGTRYTEEAYQALRAEADHYRQMAEDLKAAQREAAKAEHAAGGGDRGGGGQHGRVLSLAGGGSPVHSP